MKYVEGFLTGMVFTLVGCVTFKFLFPKTEEEMCDCVKKVTKDMEKDLKNMN